MKKILLLSFLFAATMLSAQKPVELPLWPNGAPNNNELTNSGQNHNNEWVSDVTTPTLTVYPASHPNGMAIIMCPGGGYGGLAMKHEGHDMAPWFNTQGITYAVLKYRMPNGHHEVPLSDAEQAIRMVREHAAEWGVNPQRVGIMGASAGGHLAASLATLYSSDKTRPPATANVIGKLAHGIADDMLTTTVMACAECKKILAPAMNTRMYENPVVQDNLKLLEHYGYEVIQPASGHLACGDNGAGKMPEAETLYEYIYRDTAYEKDLTGKKILVTAGPTREAIDPVRYITNHSSGKMGYALARVAVARGADVTLVTGPTEIKKPMFVKIVPVTTAKEMFEAVKEEAADADIVCKAAAVADYRPKHIADEKVKKSDSEMSLELEKTDDILKYLGEHRKDGQFLCGFSMETENMVENSRKKLEKKKLDMIAANNLKVAGAGFQGDTNQMTLITKEDETALPMISKEETAACILDKILECMNK